MAKKVMIFDDDSSIQSLLKFFFKKRGIDILISGDGTDAVAKVKNYGPDLILMDYIMPGKDGIETVSDLRQAGVTVPIVMLTSKSFPADLDRARQAGATDYLTKPFNPTTLETAVKPYIAG